MPQWWWKFLEDAAFVVLISGLGGILMGALLGFWGGAAFALGLIFIMCWRWND